MLRRFALLLAVLLVASAVLTAVAPRPDRADGVDSTLPVTPADEDVTTAVTATLPRDRVLRAHVGDNIDLTVTAEQPDSATIAALGLTDASAPGAPAQFSFRASRAGSFPVTLTLSGEGAGRVVVSGADPPATKRTGGRAPAKKPSARAAAKQR
ncbi:MAG: hypothetical protein ACR2IP_11090 [Solirubrobacteraceae bacterium]